VGVIAHDAPAQPNHLLNAKVVVKKLLKVSLRESRIALLHFAQQALFRGEHQAAAIHVNAAAFQDHMVRLAAALGCPLTRGFSLARNQRREMLQLERAGDAVRDLVVIFPVGVLGPGVEAPVDGGDAVP
jgi:hypothetical protein